MEHLECFAKCIEVRLRFSFTLVNSSCFDYKRNSYTVDKPFISLGNELGHFICTYTRIS